jgi:hypothetical protein
MRRSGFRPLSIAEIAERAASGSKLFDLAVREFLDSWQGFSPADRVEALSEEPPPVGRVENAYLAALAEHLASEERFDAPTWTEGPNRFLREPFFSGGLESLKAILIVESPSAFRRRLIFISADGLSRPHRVYAEEEEAGPPAPDRSSRESHVPKPASK